MTLCRQHATYGFIWYRFITIEKNLKKSISSSGDCMAYGEEEEEKDNGL